MTNRNKAMKESKSVKLLDLSFEGRSADNPAGGTFRPRGAPAVNIPRPHGGHRGTKGYPLSPYSFNKSADDFHYPDLDPATREERWSRPTSASPGWAIAVSHEQNHSGESPLFVHNFLASSRVEQKFESGNWPKHRSNKSRQRPLSANDVGKFYRPNSTHQYLTTTELKNASESEIDLKLGKPTRTTLLRARQKCNSTPTNAYDQRRELLKQAEQRMEFRKSLIPSYSMQELMGLDLSSEESLHSFLIGARYNRANCLDINSLITHGVYMPRGNPQGVFVVQWNRNQDGREDEAEPPPPPPDSPVGSCDSDVDPYSSHIEPASSRGQSPPPQRPPSPTLQPQQAWAESPQEEELEEEGEEEELKGEEELKEEEEPANQRPESGVPGSESLKVQAGSVTDTGKSHPTEDNASVNQEPLVPPLASPILPDAQEHLSPRKFEPSSPRKIEPSSPRKIEPSSPKKVDPLLLKKAEQNPEEAKEDLESVRGVTLEQWVSMEDGLNVKGRGLSMLSLNQSMTSPRPRVNRASSARSVTSNISTTPSGLPSVTGTSMNRTLKARPRVLSARGNRKPAKDPQPPTRKIMADKSFNVPSIPDETDPPRIGDLEEQPTPQQQASQAQNLATQTDEPETHEAEGLGNAGKQGESESEPKKGLETGVQKDEDLGVGTDEGLEQAAKEEEACGESSGAKVEGSLESEPKEEGLPPNGEEGFESGARDQCSDAYEEKHLDSEAKESPENDEAGLESGTAEDPVAPENQDVDNTTQGEGVSEEKYQGSNTAHEAGNFEGPGQGDDMATEENEVPTSKLQTSKGRQSRVRFADDEQNGSGDNAAFFLTEEESNPNEIHDGEVVSGETAYGPANVEGREEASEAGSAIRVVINKKP